MIERKRADAVLLGESVYGLRVVGISHAQGKVFLYFERNLVGVYKADEIVGVY